MIFVTLRSSASLRTGVVKTFRCTPQLSVIKDREYYLNLDLGCVPQSVKDSPQLRATDELWGDTLTSIWWRSQSAPIPTAQLREAVGEPDGISNLHGNDEAWSYNWLGNHGPNTYRSSTPFHVRDGAVIGIVERNGDS